MKSKKAPAVTLQAIQKIIDDSLDKKLDEKLKFTNSKIVGIYGELDEIKQEIKTHRRNKNGF